MSIIGNAYVLCAMDDLLLSINADIKKYENIKKHEVILALKQVKEKMEEIRKTAELGKL